MDMRSDRPRLREDQDWAQGCDEYPGERGVPDEQVFRQDRFRHESHQGRGSRLSALAEVLHFQEPG